MGRPKGASGGVANEGGSLHRAGVAAYFAAHGLAGRALTATLGIPVAVRLETSHPVDDLACDFVDRTSLYLSAKRTCGMDTHFRATVGQWVAGVAALAPGDRLGLVVREPKGLIKNLGGALDRRRSTHGGVLSPDENAALTALEAEFPSDIGLEIRQKVLDAAVVLRLDVELEEDASFRVAAFLLEGVVVAHGQGMAAMRALRDAFHEQAGSGAGSGIDEWLDVLTNAKLTVYRDGDGPAGPRRHAERVAVAGYRTGLAEGSGQIEFGLLAEGLPPMRYEGLAERMRVVGVNLNDLTRASDLLPVARAWPRLLLAGLPGMGKSQALREIAGAWAADPAAPLPILVRLPELARTEPRSHGEVSLSRILEVASATMPPDDQAPLQRAMAEALRHGDAALLLDGLDECRLFTGVIADALARIAGEVHPDSTIIVSCRESASTAAKKMGFPSAILDGLGVFNPLPGAVLRHVAARIEPGERPSWLHERLQWIDTARQSGKALWDVPLLGILMALLAANDTRPSPGSAAQILVEAIDLSVRSWERNRPELITRSGEKLTPPMLLDGYCEIAYVLATSTRNTSRAAREAVAAVLSGRWGMSPGAAVEAASDVLHFWGEHMGTFLPSTQRDELEARSQVFVEIGEAKRAAGLDAAAQQDWLMRRTTDGVSPETLALAAGLSESIATKVTDYAVEHHDGDLLIRVSEALRGSDPRQDTLTTLIEGLAAFGRKASSGPVLPVPSTARASSTRGRLREAEGPVWPFGRELAILRVPAELRGERDAVLADFALRDDQLLVAQALTILGDADVDRRTTLTADERETIQSALSLPFPDDKITRRQPSRRVLAFDTPTPMLSGRAELAERAVPYLGSLGEGAAAQVAQIGKNSRIYQSLRVHESLTQAGHTVEGPFADSQETFETMAAQFADYGANYATVLQAIAETCDVPLVEAASRMQMWRLPELAEFMALVDVNDDFLTMYHDGARLPAVFRIIAKAYGIDLAHLAQQASVAHEAIVVDAVSLPHLTVPLWHDLPEPDAGILDADDITELIAAIGSRSNSLAQFAFVLLQRVSRPDIAARVREQIPDLAPARRKKAYIFVASLTTDRAALCVDLLEREDPAGRAAAAHVLKVLADDPEAARILARALDDDDLTVRLNAGATQQHADAAARWSCPKCGHYNSISELDCSGCDTGARPGAHPGSASENAT